MGEEKEE